MRTLALLGIAAIVAACSVPLPSLTPDEQAYLDAALAHPITFTVPTSAATDAWGRAQSWVGRNASMKIQTATDYVLQTYNPASSALDYGYYVTRTPIGDQTEFTVECVTGNMFDQAHHRNARLLAYYIATGLPTPAKLVAK